MIVFKSPNAAFTHAAHQLHHPAAPAAQFAACPAHPHPPPHQLHPAQPVFTNHTIKLAPSLPTAPAIQPCHPLPLKENVQLVKSQLPCTLICNKQLVGVIVNILAAEPAAHDV